MKELLPAEWFPISIMLIFFLGARSLSPRLSAASISPRSGSVYRLWQSLRIRSFTPVVAASKLLAAPRLRTRLDMVKNQSLPNSSSVGTELERNRGPETSEANLSGSQSTADATKHHVADVLRYKPGS